MRLNLAVLSLLAACAHVHAQDVSVMAGQLKVNATDEKTFVGAVTYAHPVGDYYGMSLSYINEGHPEDHHRDGIAGQLWLRTKRDRQGLSLGVGAGRYFFFDTAKSAADYDNDHGWGNIVSLQAAWHFDSRWSAQVQANRVFPKGKDATTQLMVGASYRFDGVPGAKLHLNGPSTDDTLTVMSGQTIVNSFHSERARPIAIEYRRAVSKYLDWTTTVLKEGDTALTERKGVATQLWLIRSLSSTVELGMGAGPYVASDPEENGKSQTRLAGLITIGARYHFNQRWVGQLAWNRVVTDYHRDADILLLGLGASF